MREYVAHRVYGVTNFSTARALCHVNKRDGGTMEKRTKEQRRWIDQHVEDKLRIFLKKRGLSQEKLASQGDLTFQQLQKNERGSNKISISVLYFFAQILNVSIETFFDKISTKAIALMSLQEKSAKNLFGSIN